MVKKVLITGASSGIGWETACYYAAHGWHVTALARSADKLADLVARYPNHITAVSIDLTDLAALTAWQQNLASSCRFDVVILNAGNCEYVDVEQLDLVLFERTFSLNFHAVVACTALLLPHISAPGTLAIVSSMAHFFPFTKSEAYGASKAAVSYFAESLRVDLAKTTVRVCLIEPGFIDTPLTQKNDFAMPFLMPVSEAAKRIFHGINAGKLRLRFPRRLAFLLRLLGALPYGVRCKVATRMKQA